MSALRLAVLALAWAAACCQAAVLTQNPDTPEYVLLANIVVEHLKDHMDTELAPLKVAVDEVKTLVQEACGQTHVVDVPAPPPPFLPNPVLADLSAQLQTIQGALSDAMLKIDALEGKLQEKTEPLATSSDLKNLHNTVATTLADTLRYVENQVDDVAKKAEVEEVVREQAEGVKEAVREAQETCGSDSQVTELIQKVTEVNANVEQVKAEAQVTKGKVEQCVGQNATEEARGVGVKVEEVERKVEELRDVLEVKLRDIAGKVGEISNTTQLLATTPPPPPQEEEEEEEEGAVTSTDAVYPCLDSTFIGTRSAKICQLAVRFKKCLLPSVSYHCCLTCTSQGQLPEMGAWRHIHLPRKVTALQVIRFFAP